MSSITPWISYKSEYKPQYQTVNSAGVDLQSIEDIMIPAGKWAVVPTGLFMEIPQDFMGMVCPRSGLAAKHGVTVLNAPGIIDADYRGEIKVILINHGPTDYSIKKGDRIAQLIFAQALQGHLSTVNELSNTARGAGGFGSTGR
jgi:dUTP pyrophosphatase